ncbi:MAG: leucine--tRNA ligase [Gammaproteobacteria bacterium]|nr:leucine--tRNA ligase [Gammaproteobacteria bacterium]
MTVERDRYDHRAVERKWQEEWERRGVNLFTEEDLRNASDPYYNLMMFPYPSADGLHIGNIFAYTGADVNGRYWRLRGKDVFEPIGFDAFGIHSENYALKVGANPNDLIPQNIANFTRVLRQFGGMYDWNHEVNTTQADYYRWTQWVFLKLFHGGLVERREAPANWCPSCKTVLANEQVIQGLCERCDSAVEQRSLPQWFFRITRYAERLLDNIEGLDWSDVTKKAQTNWIGRSEGARIDFPVADHDAEISVFTTRPDTLFGATYMVLAPEHPLVDSLTTSDRWADVEEYRTQVTARDLVERQKVDKEKTGVFLGSHAINPATDARIPIWIADYVLMEYGAGAIMAVPGHDTRDFEFAETFDLPIVRVIAPAEEDASSPLAEAYVGDGVMVNSGRFDGLSMAKGKRAVVDWLADEKDAGRPHVNYRLHDWCVSRQRYWGPPIPIIHCEACGAVPVPESDLPVELPYLKDFRPDDSGVSPLRRATEFYETTCPTCGAKAHRDTDVTDNFLCSGWYFLRYPSADRDDLAVDPELTRKWLPVDSYIGGNEHAVLHLMYARFLTMALNDVGVLDFDEPFTRFRAHGLVLSEGRKMSKSRGAVVLPNDIIDRYGADTMRLYLLFLGPYEQGGDWQSKGLQGPRGFLNRLWQSVLASEEGPPDSEVERELHRTIKQVTEQTPALHFNTAIAAMMGYLNTVRAGGRTPARSELKPLLLLLAPYAPHIAEELYARMGHAGGIFGNAAWPDYDPGKLVGETLEIPVQVNGRLRGVIEMPRDASEDDVLKAARENENVARHLAAATVRKAIFVPGKLLNLVVG